MLVDSFNASIAGPDVVLLDFELFARLSALDAAYEQDAQNVAPLHRALSLLEERRREDLIAIWAERAFAVNPHHETSLFAMATCFELMGYFDRAIPLWRELLTRNRTFDPLWLQLANALTGAGGLSESLAITKSGLARLASGEKIRSHVWNTQEYRLRLLAARGEVLLRRGDPAGFADHEAMLGYRVPSCHVTGIPNWDGQSPQGRHLLITALGGYGDQLLFNALVPRLKAAQVRVTLVVHADLQPLLAASLPGVEVVATAMPQGLHEPAPPEIAAAIARSKPDFQITNFGLPRLCLALERPQPIAFAPYLSVPPAATGALAGELAVVRKKAAGRRLVGIAWDRAQRHFPHIVGGVEACRTARASFPVAELAKVVSDPRIAADVHFVALHESDATRSWPEPLDNLSRLRIEPGDFARTAALLQACSEIVSVDMSVANLAAMLGRVTTVIVAREGDWRWGQSGPGSPWVAGVRTIRQLEPREWAQVGENLTFALDHNNGPARYTAL